MGNPQFNRQTTISALTGRKLQFDRIYSAGVGDVIQPYEKQTFYLAPPSGHMASLMDFTLLMPFASGATSGSYQFHFKVNDGDRLIFIKQTDWTKDLKFDLMFLDVINDPNIDHFPTNQDAFVNRFALIRFDEENPLEIEFWNNTNGTMPQADVRLMVVLEKVAV